MKRTIKRILAAVAVLVWAYGLLSVESLADRLSMSAVVLILLGLFALAAAAVPLINHTKIFD